MQSLFGHLATRFAAHPENLATEALAFLLRCSSSARRAFVEHIRSFCPEIPPELVFKTQVGAQDGAIPDLVGFDAREDPVVILEVKFWAGLTENQPSTYLSRLPSSRPGLLAFIAPEARLPTLWPELLRRVAPVAPPPSDSSVMALSVGATHRMALTSWRAAIRLMEIRLLEDGDPTALSDLRQLSGLCEHMDSFAFLPLRDEELSPMIGRRITQFCSLVDDATASLVEGGLADIKGLRAAGSAGRYGRYLRLRGHECLLYLNANAWATYRETPIWLWVRPLVGETSQSLRGHLSPLEREVPSRLIIDPDGSLVVPLFLLTGCERDQVLEDLLSQVREVRELLPLAASTKKPAQADEAGDGDESDSTSS